MANKAIFLDRDDTLIEDPGYINDPDDVKLLPGVGEALAALKRMGYKLVVVTNQSAVARGIVSEEVLDQIHERLETLLSREGVYLDGIYYCPYHPEGVIPKYRRESDYRKPNPGMLIEASRDMNIDLKQSWMVGNSYRDVAAGERAGCRTILISLSAKPAIKQGGDPTPDNTAVNIKEAVNIIKMHQRKNPIRRGNRGRGRDKRKATNERQESQRKPERSYTPEPEPVVEEAPTVAVEEETQQEVVTQPVEEVVETVEAVSEQDTAKPEPAVEAKPKPAPEKSITPQKTDEAPAAPAAKPQPAVQREEVTPIPTKNQEMLEEIMRRLKKLDRLNMYDEFSWIKVIATIVQVVVVFLLLLSVWFVLDPTVQTSSVHTVLGYATVLQLMVIACYLMRDRR